MTDTQAIDVVTFEFKGTDVFPALSETLLVIKGMSLKCKTFLNDQRW